MRYSLLPLLMLAVAAAADWPQWRGPQRDGTAAGWQAPANWPKTLKQQWRVEIGEGHSSPVTAGARVCTLSRQGSDEVVAAWEIKGGKQLWRQSYPAPYQMHSAAVSHGKGPKSTPVIDGTRVYTFGISGVLSAWDLASGKLVWQKNFSREFRETSPAYGVAASPLVRSGLLIVPVGGEESGAILALDAATGSERWRWKGDGPAYSSPVVASFDGVQQVITHTRNRLVSLSLSNGELLWSIPFTTAYDQNSITPLIYRDMLIYSGLSSPVTAIQPRRSQSNWITPKVWETPTVSLYMSSLVRSGNLLYGFSHRNRGQFFAMSAEAGKVLWTSDPRQGENAAMVNAGGVILALLNDATLLVFREDANAFRQIVRYQVADSPAWAHPVPVDGGILVKDLNSLARWNFQ